MAIPGLTYHAGAPIGAGAEVRGTVALARFRKQISWLARRRALEDEIGASQQAIAERCGACRHFAYPFGSHIGAAPARGSELRSEDARDLRAPRDEHTR